MSELTRGEFVTFEQWQRFVLNSEGFNDWVVVPGENYCWVHKKTICLDPDLSNEAIFLHEVAHIASPEPEGQHKNHFHGGAWFGEFSRLVMKYMQRKDL